MFPVKMIDPKRLAHKIVLTFFLFSVLFLVSGSQSQTPPVNAAACGNWILSGPTISGHDATFQISDGKGGGAGKDSILAIRGLGGTIRDINIDQYATSVTATLPDDWYRAVMVYTTCEISNTRTFAIPDNGSGNGGGGGNAECSNFNDCTLISNTTPPGYTSDKFITKLVSEFLPIAIGLGGFLSVIIVVISGLQFITSNGNPEGAAAARGRLIFALVGFVLLTLAFAITKVIDTMLLRGSGIF